MPAAQYEFTGYVTTGFPDYRDTATGRMLVAEPGGSYGIEAINGGGLPPGTGQWATASGGSDTSSGAPPGPPAPPSVPSVPAVNAQEGGE